MQIGEVIRTYRKKANMTQEEMASRLGVTPPAVNKWEKGNSLPDIMLLAPIARLLGISVDTLLVFQEELTEQEINTFIRELAARLKEENFEETFCWAKEKLEQYPNCEQLIWQTAVMLDAHRPEKDVAETEKYDAYINKCYIRVLKSEREDIRNSAAESLFNFYLRREDYEKAESYLTYFSKQNPDRKRKQAVLYSEKGRRDEAYQLYEELLFSHYQMASMIFQSLYVMAVQDEDMEKARMFVEKQGQLAYIFEMGEYHEVSPWLDLATAEKDKDLIIETMEKMIKSVDAVGGFSESPLYRHMKFRNLDHKFGEEMKNNLLMCFRDEETYGFLKDDERWQELVG